MTKKKAQIRKNTARKKAVLKRMITRSESHINKLTAQVILRLSWTNLADIYALRPITNEEDYRRALDVARDLSTTPKLNKKQAQYLDTLATLIEAWEETHHPIDLSHITPLEVLEFLLEENGLKAKDLGNLLGDESLGSKILNGKRNLSKAHIIALAKRFNVSTDLFLMGEPAPLGT